MIRKGKSTYKLLSYNFACLRKKSLLSGPHTTICNGFGGDLYLEVEVIKKIIQIKAAAFATAFAYVSRKVILSKNLLYLKYFLLPFFLVRYSWPRWPCNATRHKNDCRIFRYSIV